MMLLKDADQVHWQDEMMQWGELITEARKQKRDRQLRGELRLGGAARRACGGAWRGAAQRGVLCRGKQSKKQESKSSSARSRESGRARAFSLLRDLEPNMWAEVAWYAKLASD